MRRTLQEVFGKYSDMAFLKYHVIEHYPALIEDFGNRHSTRQWEHFQVSGVKVPFRRSNKKGDFFLQFCKQVISLLSNVKTSNLLGYHEIHFNGEDISYFYQGKETKTKECLDWRC